MGDMNNGLIFLDIDGVLNNTPCCPKGPRIMPEQAANLSALVQVSGASIVVTSSWRKWVHPDCMTVLGFRRLLYTHGIDADIDILPGDYNPDELIKRAEAIAAYRIMHAKLRPFVVLDDKPVLVANLVQTDGHVGLTCYDVVTAYKLLRDQP